MTRCRWLEAHAALISHFAPAGQLLVSLLALVKMDTAELMQWERVLLSPRLGRYGVRVSRLTGYHVWLPGVLGNASLGALQPHSYMQLTPVWATRATLVQRGLHNHARLRDRQHE